MANNPIKKILLLFGHENNLGGVVNFYSQVLPLYPTNKYEIHKYRVGRVQRSKASNYFFIRFFDLVAGYTGFIVKYLKLKPHIIHINPSYNSKAVYRDFVFIFLANLFSGKTKILIHFRGWDPFFFNSAKRRDRFVRKHLLNMTDAIIVLAGEFEKQIKNVTNKKPVFVIPTTAPDFHFINKETFNHQPVSILFLARMEKEKGIYDIMEAAKQLQQKNRNEEAMRFHICGDGSEYQNIKNLISKNKLSSTVHLHGYVKGNEKEKQYLQADIFLFPSYHDEGCPNAVIEAFAAGLPLITTPIGAVKDLVQENENGFFIHANNPAEIVEKLEELIANPQLMQKMSFNNRHKYLQELSPKKIVEKIETVYQMLLSEN